VINICACSGFRRVLPSFYLTPSAFFALLFKLILPSHFLYHCIYICYCQFFCIIFVSVQNSGLYKNVYVVPVLNWAPRHEPVLRNGGIAPLVYVTSALDGGAGQLHAPANLLPRKEPLPVGCEVGWAPEPVWTWWRSEKFPATGGTRTPITYSVSQRYTTELSRLLI
jgi:hypothetical protein